MLAMSRPSFSFSMRCFSMKASAWARSSGVQTGGGSGWGLVRGRLRRRRQRASTATSIRWGRLGPGLGGGAAERDAQGFGLAAFDGAHHGVEGAGGGGGGGDVAGAVAVGLALVHADAPAGGGGVIGGEGLDTEHDLDFVAGVEGGEGEQGAVHAAVLTRPGVRLGRGAGCADRVRTASRMKSGLKGPFWWKMARGRRAGGVGFGGGVRALASMFVLCSKCWVSWGWGDGGARGRGGFVCGWAGVATMTPG